MKKKIKSIYIIELIILLLTVILFFVQNLTYQYILSVIGFLWIFLISRLVYRKKKDTSFYRVQAFRIVVIVLLFFYIIVSLMGLILGFTKTMFSLNPKKWIQGLIPMLLITIMVEQTRFILIKNNTADKKGYIGITILLILFNVALSENIFAINNFYRLFIFTCVTFMPIIAKEMLSSYMVKNYGFLPTFTYKIIMNIYIYILPIMTDLGDYLYSAIGIIMPFTLYMILNKYLKPDEDIRQKNKKIKGLNINFIIIPVIIFLIVIIILVSGIFKFQMIAIASNSMVPVYERGDTIIFEKVDVEDIKIGDIVVFKRNMIIVAHRIVKIKEESSKKYFFTKGDANNSVDVGVVDENNMLGVVRRVVKYIGYPTVWINELFGGD